MEYARKAILRDLFVIGSLKEGERIACRADEYLDVDTADMFTGLARMMRGDCRARSCDAVETTISRTIEAIEEMAKTAPSDAATHTLMHTMLEALVRAAEGVSVLSRTYQGDRATEARLKVLRVRMDSEVGRLREMVGGSSMMQ
jgi:hypothetical protein